jgi:hypothetical protein
MQQQPLLPLALHSAAPGLTRRTKSVPSALDRAGTDDMATSEDSALPAPRGNSGSALPREKSG